MTDTVNVRIGGRVVPVSVDDLFRQYRRGALNARMARRVEAMIFGDPFTGERKMYVLAYAHNRFSGTIEAGNYAQKVRPNGALFCGRGVEKALTFPSVTAAAQALYRHARSVPPRRVYPYGGGYTNVVAPAQDIRASSERWEIVEVREVPQPKLEVVGKV